MDTMYFSLLTIPSEDKSLSVPGRSFFDVDTLTCVLILLSQYERTDIQTFLYEKMTAAVLTCCIVLMVVDEFWDGAEIMLLCQVKLTLCGGADVIMSASASVPADTMVRIR